jgi:hypothetical protein
MKKFEIILKITFLIAVIRLFFTHDFWSYKFEAFLGLCVVLGLVLVFNKRESYGYPAGYPRMKNVYLTRRIEGVLLVLFAIVMFVLLR